MLRPDVDRTIDQLSGVNIGRSPSPPLVSILVPSRRPHQFAGLIESLHNTLSDPDAVEVLAKVDDDNPDLLEKYRTIVRDSPIPCRLVIGPRFGGVFTLWIGMEEALAQSHKQAYFVIALTDEGRFLTPNWDKILQKYVGHFPDNAFRLRVSRTLNLVQYPNYLTCSTMPDSFPVFTRRWLELTEGFTRFSYGFDAYQQMIATRLAMDDTVNRDIWNSRGIFRDIPIFGIELGGIDFSKDISEVEQVTRMVVGTREWLRLCSYDEQLHISYLATKLRLYIVCKSMFACAFHFDQNTQRKSISVIAETGELLARESYRISRPRTYYFYARLLLGLAPSRVRYLLSEISLVRRRRTKTAGAKERKRRPWRALYRNAVRSKSSPREAQRFQRVRWMQTRWYHAVGRVDATLMHIASWGARIHSRYPSLRVNSKPLTRLLRIKEWIKLALRKWSIRAAIRTKQRQLPRRRISTAWIEHIYRQPTIFLLGYLCISVIKQSRRYIRDQSTAGRIADFIMYPLDRLLPSAPALSERFAKLAPFGTYYRLRRLGYPVSPRHEILKQAQNIQDIKNDEYRRMVF